MPKTIARTKKTRPSTTKWLRDSFMCPETTGIAGWRPACDPVICSGLSARQRRQLVQPVLAEQMPTVAGRQHYRKSRLSIAVHGLRPESVAAEEKCQSSARRRAAECRVQTALAVAEAPS